MASADDSANDLAAGPRIFKTPTDFGVKFNRGDGPFKSLRNLKRNSPIYKRLSKNNTKRLQQILKEKNIVELTNTLIPYPKDKGIPQDMLRMITHSTKGHITKGKVRGIHFYDSRKVKILKEFETDEKSGVWNALIEYYDKQTDKWYVKDEASTFFPKNWTFQQLFYECMHALENQNMQLVEGSKSKYVSRTITGIAVHIVKIKGKLKTIYPIIGE